MSEQLSFDRSKGFVALPVEILEIEMTPGAFRLLAELCRMANLEGYCWPSLDQLSDRMGRSKSAISGYIKELREAALVDTKTQTTANGYNYRLKYRVTFWAEWRASLKGSTTPKSERSVRHTERLEESKNHIQINHTPPLAERNVDKILNSWARCFQGAPYPTATLTPTDQLLGKTQALLEVQKPAPIITADIKPLLQTFWKKRSVSVPPALLAEQLAILAQKHPTPRECQALLKGLAKAWQSHWKRPPNAEAFEKLLQSVKLTTQYQKLTLLQSYRSRWELAQKTLRSPAYSGSLTQTKKVAA